MKAVVVHQAAKVIERDWAAQYAGLDPAVKAEFATTADFPIRVPKVFTIAALTWTNVVTTVSDAAKAAGAGGVVIIASGHGGVGRLPDEGIINWDATDGDVARGWVEGKVKKGLFWDEDIAQYTDSLGPLARPGTLKEQDEQNIKNNVKNAKILQMRHDAFDALQAIGQALQANAVKRLTFTVCTAGAATGFMDRLAKHCHAQVACFKVTTMVLDDHTFGITPGKARLVLESDASADGRGSNTRRARVFSPNLDDTSIARVSNP
jgi:hypothetical protein